MTAAAQSQTPPLLALPDMFESVFANRRPRAVAIHLVASAVLAGLASMMVFLVWYPRPFDAIAGGATLFLMLVGVDVVMGPALTAVVANPAKPRPELRRDLVVIVLFQLTAMAYGLYTVALARPVFVSFEVDRFRVVAAADVEPGALQDAPTTLRALPWTGPQFIAAVKPVNPGEQMRSLELGLAGLDLSMIPANWREYASQTEAVWRVSKPASALLARYPQSASEVAAIAARAGQQPQALRWLPLMSRRASWVALVAAPGSRVVGYLPLDGFF